MGFFDGIVSAIPIVGDVISGFGQAQTNQKNWDIAQSQNQTNTEMQNDAQAWNADQAILNRTFQADQAQKSMDFSASQAQTARDYTTSMSNTSYQRAVGDLQAAGLNPMLAYAQGGASTPTSPSPSGNAASGSQASIGAQRAASVAPMQNALSGASGSAMKVAQIMNMTEQNELLKAQVHNTDTQSDLTRAKYFNELDLNPKVRKEVDKILAEIGLLNQQSRFSSASTSKTYQDIAIGKPEAAKAGTTWGGFSPYIKDITSALQGLTSFGKLK